MSNILIDRLTLPIPGRTIRNPSELPYPHSTDIQVSMTQVLKERRDSLTENKPFSFGIGGVHGVDKEIADQYTKGRDLIWTTDIGVELPLKIDESGAGSLPALTVVEFFADAVRRFGDSPALAFEPHFVEDKNDDGGSQRVCFAKGAYPPKAAPPSYQYGPLSGWLMYTWQAVWNECCFFAKSLIHLEAPPLSRVCIMGCNAPAWAISFYGAMFAGGISVGIYTTNTAEAAKHVVCHSQCRIAIVDTIENLEKMLQIRSEQRREAQERQAKGESLKLIPGGAEILQMIVMYRDAVPDGLEQDGVISFDEFLNLGRGVSDAYLAARMEYQKPGQCCNIVYTSGTTGLPKGVMLSHDNLTWTATSLSQIISIQNNDRFISYLPLSHVAAQIVDLIAPLVGGACVFFARPDALRGTLLLTLKKVRPTWFLGVPRVWEKMEQSLKQVGAKAQGFRKQMSTWAKDLVYRGTIALLQGKPVPTGFNMVNNYLIHQVRKALGFDQCQGFGSCAAPIDPETQKYFLSLGMPINSIFGLSESTGPQTFIAPAPGWFAIGSIGHTLPGTDVLVCNPDSEGQGELAFRGRNIFMGYLNNVEATVETIDEHGFLHTGDMGKIDDQGFIFITGRIKELLITAGGENVAPVLIESILKQELPVVSNCMVVGDKKPFLVVLIALSVSLDANDQPTQQLSSESKRVFQQVGSNALTTIDAATDYNINMLIKQAIERTNLRTISRAQRITGWRVIPDDFSVQNGDLTATLKLRRKVVCNKYQSLIDELYKQPEPPCISGAGVKTTSRL